MARADLIVRLVQSGMQGDKSGVKNVTEAIIAEERAMQHKALADKLEKLINAAPTNNHSNKFRGMAGTTDGRRTNLVYEAAPQKTLTDLVLPNEVTQICRELIEEQHKIELLRSYNLEPRNRVLLIGPPGNGKTSLAEAIAAALSIPLLVVRYESLIGTYLGETTSRLQKMFEYVLNQKCVLFFDEFEAIGKERGDLHETGEIKRVVSSLLLQIDNLPSHIIAVGATNHPEMLDRAVWRRFQVRMTLPNPTHEQLIDWFKNFEKRSKIPLGFPPEYFAKRLQGLSFAEVEEFGETALRRYVLDMPNSSMKKIVTQTLKNWSFRSATANQQEETETN